MTRLVLHDLQSDKRAGELARLIESLAAEGRRLVVWVADEGRRQIWTFVEDITAGVKALGCGVTAYPGENEMYALAKGALRVLSGREIPGDYNPDVKDVR